MQKHLPFWVCTLPHPTLLRAVCRLLVVPRSGCETHLKWYRLGCWRACCRVGFEHVRCSHAEHHAAWRR